MSDMLPIAVEHPGVFIRDELDARGWSQADLAYILGTNPQRLNRLLNGKSAISPEMALALSDAFGISGDFFANLQKRYDLQEAKRPDPGIRVRAKWAIFPVREMIGRGWIEDKEPDLLDLQMLRFFNVASIEDIPFIGDVET